jgi:hypothetical protein
VQRQRSVGTDYHFLANRLQHDRPSNDGDNVVDIPCTHDCPDYDGSNAVDDDAR